MNSLDFNLALKVVSCTLSSALSTSKISQVKHFPYDLRVPFSPCLIVSRWSAGLFGRCPPIKWRKKELPSCSKLSKDDVCNLVNHSLAAPSRVVAKERHKISSRGCWRPEVVLKVLRWFRGSFSPSNGSSCSRRNFEGTEHFRTTVVKGEFVLLTILSRLRSIFSLITFLSLPISFLISWRRSKFTPSEETGCRRSSLLWLSPSSSRLVSKRLSSCCSLSLISWFYLVSSSMLATRV